jgi:hypothetical protein
VEAAEYRGVAKVSLAKGATDMLEGDEEAKTVSKVVGAETEEPEGASEDRTGTTVTEKVSASGVITITEFEVVGGDWVGTTEIDREVSSLVAGVMALGTGGIDWLVTADANGGDSEIGTEELEAVGGDSVGATEIEVEINVRDVGAELSEISGEPKLSAADEDGVATACVERVPFESSGGG